MAKIGKIQEVAISKLKPYERNAKQHSKQQVEKIADSIREFGFLSPCLIDKQYNLIAGHGRIEACRLIGIEKVPCLFIEGLTEAQRKAYILADNKLTELGGWDYELVSSELEGLKQAGFDINLTGFDIDDIIITDDMGAEIEESGVEEITEGTPRIKRGEIYQLGRHRLMCGDSTSEKDVEKLTGGANISLLLTEPPYNVDVSNSKGDKIANDALPEDEFRDFLYKVFVNASNVMADGAAYYVWHASKSVVPFVTALQNAGLELKQQIIWVKNQFVLGRQDYQCRHEPCLYGWKEGAGHYFIDVRSLSTVIEKDREQITLDEAMQIIEKYEQISTIIYENKPMCDADHPTMKPVPLFKKLIRNSSREGDNVLDLFGGSGTTLVACEEMNRNCYMMEYDPKHAEVIIKRWEKLTGKTAIKTN